MKYADVRDSQLAQGMNCEPARKEATAATATVAGYATARPAAAGVVSEPGKKMPQKTNAENRRGILIHGHVLISLVW